MLDRSDVSPADNSRLIADLSRELLGQAPPASFLREIEKQLKDAESEGMLPAESRDHRWTDTGIPEFQKR